MADPVATQLAQLRAELTRLGNEPHTDWNDIEIREVQRKIRELDPATRGDPELHNPHAMEENLSLFTESDDVHSAVGSMQQERERDAEAKRRAKEEADTAPAREELRARMGPAELALVDRADPEANPPTKAELDEARAKDSVTKSMVDQAAKSGCLLSPKVLTAIGVGAAVVIAVILVLLNGSSDDEKTAATAGAQPPAAVGDDAIANFAGHYVLVKGFDDPSGIDVFYTEPGAYASVTPGPSSASFDIDATGKITAGTVRASIALVGANNCTFALEGSFAAGQVRVSPGVGAYGDMSYTVTMLGDGTCNKQPYEQTNPFTLGIIDNSAVLCRSAIEPSLNTCGAAYPRIVATFVKQG